MSGTALKRASVRCNYLEQRLAAALEKCFCPAAVPGVFSHRRRAKTFLQGGYLIGRLWRGGKADLAPAVAVSGELFLSRLRD
ncbi:hypothetical protein C4J81_19010 (plasmid) [Deltaproteobacteria bacterium Smac51]|nr:hypothetical protein C4J81_19010 [Deltaproteobacteria bacterium Smac51]